MKLPTRYRRNWWERHKRVSGANKVSVCRNIRKEKKRNKKVGKKTIKERMKEIIRLEHIKRDFKVGDEMVHALRGVSFVIQEGEFVTIMGTSGSGKSTLLNTLGCLDTPTSGDYFLDGVSVRTMGKNARATLLSRQAGCGW